MAIINLGPIDINLAVTAVLPAAGQNVTTGILDLQAVAPNSNAWRLGRLAVTIPALPENNTGAGITIAMQVAQPSLVASQPAPALPVPGAFITAPKAQTVTIPAVAAGGSPATLDYFTLEFDPNGSVYPFYQFVITVPAGVVTQGETVQIAWVCA